MTDRELLELAAKAAGIRLHVWGTAGEENFADMDKNPSSRWNPLTDDGDALRLAVKLGLIVNSPSNNLMPAEVMFFDVVVQQPVENEDPYTATRRAIVRAAAEIGKEIP